MSARYRAADSCAATGRRNAIAKSSFQPTIVLSVPRNATYDEPSPTSNTQAENCLVVSGSNSST